MTVTGKQVQEAIDREAGEEKPAEVDMHDDRTRENRTPSFSRMRFDWNPHDRPIIDQIMKSADDRIAVEFTDVYRILNDVYNIVREQAHDPETGAPLVDRFGFPVWAKNESDRYIEDWERLGHKDRENFLFMISTRLYEWEQKAADLWAEAMFAKAQWEERFALAFADDTLGGRKTDEAMTQRARSGSRDERYFALFEATVSRKADALVKSMDRLQQRLKDSLYS